MSIRSKLLLLLLVIALAPMGFLAVTFLESTASLGDRLAEQSPTSPPRSTTTSTPS